jgi:hypothetical protein
MQKEGASPNETINRASLTNYATFTNSGRLWRPWEVTGPPDKKETAEETDENGSRTYLPREFDLCHLRCPPLDYWNQGN